LPSLPSSPLYPHRRDRGGEAAASIETHWLIVEGEGNDWRRDEGGERDGSASTCWWEEGSGREREGEKGGAGKQYCMFDLYRPSLLFFFIVEGRRVRWERKASGLWRSCGRRFVLSAMGGGGGGRRRGKEKD